MCTHVCSSRSPNHGERTRLWEAEMEEEETVKARAARLNTSKWRRVSGESGMMREMSSSQGESNGGERVTEETCKGPRKTVETVGGRGETSGRGGETSEGRGETGKASGG